MMKKRVLMPLLVAGMMVASVVSLDSCKKEDQTTKAVFRDTETPVTQNLVREEGGANYECPYCGAELHHADEHWHYFGTPVPGFDQTQMMESDFDVNGVPHFWGVDECIDGLSDEACAYSGRLYDNEAAIQQVISAYQTEFGLTLTHDQAKELLAPRFHAHHIVYRAIINGGMAHTWHVGGGVPGWPGPHPELPDNPSWPEDENP